MSIPPTTSKARSWIGANSRPRANDGGDGPIGAEGTGHASAKRILGAGDEDAGAAGLAPDPIVRGARRAVIIVARHELALVDPQLAVEEMQLFDPGMRMRGIARTRREADQHAHA